ncbi:hypothetical protein FHW83_003096 [Duganella sp. SG902]|uniref:hypothetical protein n=1 Tax=Duganella sp. SG902 TaxID=2587016 RepID=UPI00159EA4A2|nr:hypothetical protein [Duganella sp. SG902]NVM77290.1 hypothetical protein [Duganella sp. SG902]
MKQVKEIHQLPPEQRVTFDQLSLHGQSVREIFARLNIDIRNASVLDTFLRNVDRLAARWREGNGQNVREMIDCTTAMRVFDAILAAQDDVSAIDCYHRIARKDVDLFSSIPSQGKDALWELQLLKELKSRGMNALLSEPDINVFVDEMTFPIACKKIYSINNLEGQLRSAGTQIKKSGGGGIVALNIDAQLPQNHLIVASRNNASRTLVRETENFLANNQSLFRRMFAAGKFDAVLVSVSCPVDNDDVRPRFNVATETLIWCPSGICSLESQARAEAFRAAMKLPLYPS